MKPATHTLSLRPFGAALRGLLLLIRL